MWPHQGPMLCLVCACVQDIKPHQKRVISKHAREYWGIWRAPRMLDCGTPRDQNLNLLDIWIPTMGDARSIEEALVALVNYLEDLLCHGHQRNKIVWHSLSPKPNTLVRGVVVHNYYGWDQLWRILDSTSIMCHCFVTMKVQSRWHKTRFNIQELSILI